MQPQQTPARSARRGLTSPSELLDLIGLDTPTIGVRPQPAPVQATQAVPAAVATLVAPTTRNGLFDLYIDLEAKVKALAAEARNIERELFGHDWTSVIETPKTKSLGDIANAALEKMIQQAQQRYAPHGSHLEISQHEALKAIGFDQWSHKYSRRADEDQSAPIDLDKLHAYLDATYGGEAGTNAAFKQQARILIDFFHFDKPDSMAATARYIGCTVRMWATKRDYGQNAGLYELDYRRRDELQKAFNALATAFAWSEQYDLSMDLRRQQLTRYDFYFKSRHRESFRGLECVMYSEKWEFQFSHEAAAALKLFLGQYGA